MASIPLESKFEWHTLQSLQFGFHTPSQIRRMSSCQVWDKTLYYADEPAQNGLYSPTMGICSVNDKKAICPTCGLNAVDCTGHPGHIELILPTLNPLNIDALMKLIKITCFQCHRLRVKQRVKEEIIGILQLLEKNDVIEAQKWFAQIVDGKKRKGTEEDSQSAIHTSTGDTSSDHLLAPKQGLHSATLQLYSQYVKFMYSMAQDKCPYCKKEGKKFKKQGTSKIVISGANKQKKSGTPATTVKSQTSPQSIGASGPPSDGYTTTAASAPSSATSRYITPKEMSRHVHKLWANQSLLMSLLYPSNKASMFFLEVLFVPPNRFRPESRMADQVYMHDQTNSFEKVLVINRDLVKMVKKCEGWKQFRNSALKSGDTSMIIDGQQTASQLSTLALKKSTFFKAAYKQMRPTKQFINKWLELQDAVNILFDSTRSSKLTDAKGIRQLLEKKQGLFRMRMMGKRVNHSARSVISPDPLLASDAVGVPMFMAKKLYFPEPVNQYTFQKLQSMVTNGKIYPGASMIQEGNKLTRLEDLSADQRLSLARDLWSNHKNKTVYRHLLTGDNVLFNRQPTLHKAGLMTHRVVVQPRQSTLRMNYANCRSYNADFDGDEMNMHVLQTYAAKAQAELAVSDRMFASPTSGNPLREIIQDGILGAVYLCMRDKFFARSEYSQLLYMAVRNVVEGLAVPMHQGPQQRVQLLRPTIIKPKVLWTGKQLISNVLQIVVHSGGPAVAATAGLRMRSTTKLDPSQLSGFSEDSVVLILRNELLTGLLQKSQIGAKVSYGLLHCFSELYGEILAGRLLTCLNRLFLSYMQTHGFTCGIDDLGLKKKGDKQRSEMIKQMEQSVVVRMAKELEGTDQTSSQPKNIEEEQDFETLSKRAAAIVERRFLANPSSMVEVDSLYCSMVLESAQAIQKGSIKGINKRFPLNNFSMMADTGAKGSTLNQFLVSVLLGQQQLEGRSVPLMMTGKTLPSFKAYDPSPRAHGFVSDRYLTGLRQEEFFFHCMAGRQGLVDTAVKTSRSGYLQRCLMKHLEGVKVEYDLTVRETDGSIIQFLYGDDGLDPVKCNFNHEIGFIERNADVYKHRLKYQELRSLLNVERVAAAAQNQSQLSIQQQLRPNQHIGSVSNLCWKKATAQWKQSQPNLQLYMLKYYKSMIPPGQAVGCTAAQSIGEPSTQMTLNTFHLAGHGGVNVTLGVPRLRELLMTNSQCIKTPIMKLKFRGHPSEADIQTYIKQWKRVKVSDVVESVSIEEEIKPPLREYRIVLHLENQQLLRQQFQITYSEIQKVLEGEYLTKLLTKIAQNKKKSDTQSSAKKPARKSPTQQFTADDMDDEAKVAQQKGGNLTAIQSANQYLKDNKLIGSQFSMVLAVPMTMKRFLMSRVVESIIEGTHVRQIPMVSSATYLRDKKTQESFMLTQGVNFSVLGKYHQQIDPYCSYSNDVHSVWKHLGVQAARQTIIREIISLLRNYGIQVDPRHLSLIGDHMTWSGAIRAMNRQSMNYNASPLLRMTFQTSVKYAIEAASRGEHDNCNSPSSRIIVGRPPKVGGGLCDVLMEWAGGDGQGKAK